LRADPNVLKYPASPAFSSETSSTIPGASYPARPVKAASTKLELSVLEKPMQTSSFWFTAILG
jgi:hypothetical protein